MADREPWAGLAQRVDAAVSVESTVDGVTRAALSALLARPPVLRAGLALPQQGGRLFRFTSTDGLRDGAPDVMPWCDVDGMADVPLVRAVLTGFPVLLSDLDALAARYPHLLERQVSLGTRALAAVPLSHSGHRVGGLMITLSEPLNLVDVVPVLDDVARACAVALLAAGARGLQAAGPLPHEQEVVDLRVFDEAPDGGQPTAVRLGGGATAPRQARGFLRRVLAEWQVPPDAVTDAELCLSEIVTNAVIHAGTATEVVLSLAGDRVRVVVSDEGTRDGGRSRTHQPDPGDVGGRGLVLVDHLALSWSYEETPAGTVVCFEVPLSTLTHDGTSPKVRSR